MTTSFYSQVYIGGLKDFKVEIYFSSFHYFEAFDETKNYDKESFSKDFGKGLHLYKLCLHIRDEKEKYVTTEENLTEEELIVNVITTFLVIIILKNVWYHHAK